MDCENFLWNGKNIPIDLVEDILLRLPAKALGRCMCTCKRLYSHIKSTEFMTCHFNRSKTRDNTILIVQQGCYSIFSESVTALIKQESGEMPFPVMDGDLYILGSCGGLVLVRLRVERGYLVLLWNPLLEKYKLVDTIIHDRPHGDEQERLRSSWLCVFAFGFLAERNDYRVVRITYGRRNVVDVYSFTNDNWHRVDGNLTNGKRLPYIPYPEKMASYSNGAVHWLASYDEGDFHEAMYYNELDTFEPEEVRDVVLSFDFDKEVFRLIELPIRDGRNVLKELNGKLVLFDYFSHPHYNTWVMKKYPLVESWTYIGCLFKHLRYLPVWPLACTKKENCVYRCNWGRRKDTLRYLNAKEDKIYELEIVVPYECPVIVDFVESLVLLDVENDALEACSP